MRSSTPIEPGLTNDPKVQPITLPQVRSGAGSAPQGDRIRTASGRRQRPFHRQLLAISRKRFPGAQPVRRGERRRLWPIGRSATPIWNPTTPRPSTISASRAWRRESLRSAAIEALPAAAHAGEIVRRVVRARRQKTWAASVSRAGGDSFAALSRPCGLRPIAAFANISAARCAPNRARWSL